MSGKLLAKTRSFSSVPYSWPPHFSFRKTPLIRSPWGSRWRVDKSGCRLGLGGRSGRGENAFRQGRWPKVWAVATATSPTFTLIHEYTGGRMPLYHFDFYRLESAGEALNLGLDEYLEGDGLTVIEWADKFPALLPPHTEWFHFSLAVDGGRPADHPPRNSRSLIMLLLSMLTLALDCSTSRGSVAIGGQRRREHGACAPCFVGTDISGGTRARRRVVFDFAGRIARGDGAAGSGAGQRLEKIVVGLGPGSYSGVRQAIAVATGLSLATGAALAGLPSTLALGNGCASLSCHRRCPARDVLLHRRGRGRDPGRSRIYWIAPRLCSSRLAHIRTGRCWRWKTVPAVLPANFEPIPALPLAARLLMAVHRCIELAFGADLSASAYRDAAQAERLKSERKEKQTL